MCKKIENEKKKILQRLFHDQHAHVLESLHVLDDCLLLHAIISVQTDKYEKTDIMNRLPP